MINFFRYCGFEIFGILFCLTLGILSGYSVKAGDSDWYQALIKPEYTPANQFFGPIWTILYIMIGAALGQIWRYRKIHTNLLGIFFLQFSLNLIWSPLFFYYHRIDFALYDLVILWFILIVFMARAYSLKTVLMLFLPYIIWVNIALMLNFDIYSMNYNILNYATLAYQ